MTFKNTAQYRQENGHHEPEELTHSDRTESGLTAIKEQRLISRAISRQWLKGKRWATDSTASDFQKALAERELTALEQGVLGVMSGMSKDDQRTKQIAIRNLIAMEGQNQADEHKAKDMGAAQIAPLIVPILVKSREDIMELSDLKRRLIEQANGGQNGGP